MTWNSRPKRVIVPLVLLMPVYQSNRGQSTVALYCSRNTGHKAVLRLNISWTPIAYKYREGKMKRTLKREFNST